MLVNKKIRMMTRLATYEQNEGKKDIPMSKFYKSDYVRYNLLKTLISVTIAYLLILLMIITYYSESLLNDIAILDYKALGVKALAGYVILVTIYTIGTIIGYNIKYEKSRRRLARYYKRLKNLSKHYDDAENEQWFPFA